MIPFLLFRAGSGTPPIPSLVLDKIVIYAADKALPAVYAADEGKPAVYPEVQGTPKINKWLT